MHNVCCNKMCWEHFKTLGNMEDPIQYALIDDPCHNASVPTCDATTFLLDSFHLASALAQNSSSSTLFVQFSFFFLANDHQHNNLSKCVKCDALLLEQCACMFKL